MSKPLIILASQSPRRKDYMQRMGLTFETIPSDYDEQLDENRTPDEVAMELALGKALAVATKYPNAIVVGSDCIVAVNHRQMGKARDIDDAREMLTALSGKTSTVSTGLAVVQVSAGKKISTVDVSTLNFRPNSKEFATLREEYLTTGDWRDKAGAFGIQSGGHTLVESIEGDYSSIVGLPTVLLATILTEQFGIIAKPIYDTPPDGIKNI